MESMEQMVGASPNRANRRAAGRRARKVAALGSTAMLAGSVGAAVMSIAAGTPAGALTTWTVTSLLDDGDGTCDASCTLRDAVDEATGESDASEITFAPSVTGTIVLTQGRLEVDGGNDLTVTGPGAGVLTVDGDANDNIFYSDGSFDAYTLSISGLTLTNGSTSGDGGAIEFYNDSSDAMNLVLTDMVITGNHAGSDGGGVYFYSYGSLTITNSTISSNSADGDGGGLYADAGDEATVTITNSTIADNEAGSDGGGVAIDDGALTVIGSTISGNTTTGADGGGLYLNNSGNTTTIANSTISLNTSDREGGGIAANQGDLVLLQTTISGNTAGGLGDGLYLQAAYAAPGSVPNEAEAPDPTAKADKATKSAAPDGDDVGALYVHSVSMVGTIISANGETDIDTNGSVTVDSTNSLWGTKGDGITINDLGATINSSSPGLAALADNGGPTQTMALVAGSPAIDTGPNPVPTFAGNADDQRGAGFPRVVNGTVDIGAFEVQPPPPVPSPAVIAPRFTG